MRLRCAKLAELIDMLFGVDSSHVALDGFIQPSPNYFGLLLYNLSAVCCRSAAVRHGHLHMQGSQWDRGDVVECRTHSRSSLQPFHYISPNPRAIHISRSAVQADPDRHHCYECTVDVARQHQYWGVACPLVRRRVFQPRHWRGLSSRDSKYYLR